MFKPMALTVIFALVGALALALTLMPVLCSYLLGGNIRRRTTLLVKAAKALCAGARFSLRFRWLVVRRPSPCSCWPVSIFTRLGAEFVPQLDEGSFATHMIRTTSIGLDAERGHAEARPRRCCWRSSPRSAHVSAASAPRRSPPTPWASTWPTPTSFKPQETWRKVDGRTITKDELANLMTEELTKHVPARPTCSPAHRDALQRNP
jgi:cobalt-zinc-cadmium resistance protein CzcA